MPKIRLTRKLAPTMNGIDISRVSTGDVIDLPHEQANMMVDCGWAEPVIKPFVPSSADRAPDKDLEK